ncbi:MAG: PEP-CTERM sorting domain-containing protein [Candidatus Omnitrophota bacterium]
MPYGYPAGEDREHKKRFKGKEITACLVLFLSICRPLPAQSSYDNDTLLWDSLDSGRQWSINTTGNLGISGEHKTEGKGSLSVVVKGGVPARGLVLKKSNTDLDVTFARNIILDIYNSGPPCNLAVAFKTDGLRESLPRRIESGLNRNVTFEISTKDFKVPFGDANIASEVMFVVYPADGMLRPLFFDNIRIKKYGGLQSSPINITPALLEETLPETPSELSADTSAGLYSILSGASSDDEPTVPEHKSLLIFGAGLAGFAFFRKKYFKK